MARKSRNTAQKDMLEELIAKKKDFFTAEALFEEAREINPHIGIATVYRFLKEQRENKVVNSYECDKKLIYSKNNNSHCHFICEETGKVIHFEVDSIDFLKNKIPGSIRSFQIEVRGVCDKCSKMD